MQILPSKKRYRSWSLPSKYSFWGLILGIAGLVLALLGFNPFKMVIGIDNKQAELNYLKKTQSRFYAQDYLRMLADARTAHAYADEDISAIEWLAVAYFFNNKADSSAQLLLDNESQLSDLGKWQLANSLFISGRNAEARDRYLKINVDSVPAPIRLQSYACYLSCGEKDSYYTLRLFVTNASNYSYRHIRDNSTVYFDPLPSKIALKDVTLGNIDVVALVESHAIYFMAGYTLFDYELSHGLKNQGDILTGLSVMDRGFSIGMGYIDLRTYVSFCQSLRLVLKEKNFQFSAQARAYAVKFRGYIEKALKGDLESQNGLKLTKTFTQEQIATLERCDALLSDRGK